jgi:chromatin segregation and condensation protein Rec8/ScpA/Scc1 (kleisin family)
MSEPTQLGHVLELINQLSSEDPERLSVILEVKYPPTPTAEQVIVSELLAAAQAITQAREQREKALRLQIDSAKAGESAEQQFSKVLEKLKNQLTGGKR